MGTTWRVARVASCTRRLVRKGSRPTKSASGRSRTKLAKAALISWLLLASRIWICNPIARAAGSRSFRAISVDAVFDGLRSTSTRAAVGNSSRRSSNRFPSNSLVKKLIPVRLPPGWARLATRPRLTGSLAAGCLRHAVGEIGCANGLVPPDRRKRAVERRSNSNHRRGYGTASASDNRL